jgi:hypothetical protein
MPLDYQPRDDCPKGLRAEPCPLYGGAPPPLAWGQPAGPYRGADVLPMEPGPDVSNHQFGYCAECEAMVMFDRDGVPLRARSRSKE